MNPIMTILTNKWLWVAVVFIATVALFETKILYYKHTILDLQLDKQDIRQHLDVCKNNLNIVMDANEENNATIAALEKDIKDISESFEELYNEKKSEIDSLNGIIADLNSDINYTTEHNYTTCTIKEAPNENGTIHTLISNIGR